MPHARDIAGSTANFRGPRSVVAITLAITICIGAALQSTSPATGAASTAPMVVALQAASVTALDLTGCRSGTAQTSLGTVLPSPGSFSTNASPCVVAFGSSNSTASLTLRQEDATGTAMHASPTGAADTTWSADGFRSIALSASQDFVYDSALGNDGALFVAGEVDAGKWTATVAKLRPDGTLDPTFAGGTRLLTENAAADGVFAAIAVQPDGKVLAAGYDRQGGPHDLLLARFTASGALDTTFGPSSTGWFRPASGGNDDNIYDLALLPDGRFLVYGSLGNGGNYNDVFLDRYLPDGRVDRSFANAGRLTLSYAAGSTVELGRAMVVDPADQSATLVMTTATAGDDMLRVVHVSNTGVLDSSYNGGAGARSWATTSTGWAWMKQSVAMQPDGKVVVADRDPSTGRFRVTRLTSGGGLDWVSNGIDFPSAGVEDPSSISVEAHGKILVAGTTSNGNAVGVARLTASGAIDPTFGVSGYVTHAATSSGGDRVSLEHFPDGRVIAVSAFDPPGSDPSDLATLVLAAPAVNDYGAPHTWASGDSAFGICLSSLTGTGAVTTWVTSSTCAKADDATWRAVPATAAVVGSLAGSATDGAAAFIFGMHAAENLAPGNYEARIIFEVVAP